VALYPELRGKTAIVTGGNTGIGEAVARRMAGQGVNVAVVGSRHPEAAKRISHEICAAGGNAIPVAADLTRLSEGERMVREVSAEFGQVDIVVNSAGGFYAFRRVVETDEDEWDRVIDVNLKSAFVCARSALPGMLDRGWGRVILISSEAGRMPVTLTAAHYAASKAGLLGFARHLAREVAASGVTVNVTAPSTTLSPRVRGLLGPEAEARMVGLTPIGRIADVEDQVGAVLFLASDDAAYITGATIDIAGGKVML
jgi:NAD(P)-dependent dehydrogenase (short-subunit alcohol dehydrogenase family)